jgi:hypothetical protein
MHALIATFSLQPTLPLQEYLDNREARAATYLDVPGLVAKIWLSSAEDNRHGAVYLFETREAVDAFLAGETFQRVAQSEHYRDVTTQVFEVGEAPSRVTHGWFERAGATSA